MPAYGDADYWEARYTREPSAFDWYHGYAALRPVLGRYLPPSGRLLHVGVGTSRVQEDMVRQGGYKQILNVDISTVAIAHMAELHRAVPELAYQLADVRAMPEFSDESFDGVLDKGTLDALLCGETSSEFAHKMLTECYRVLKLGSCMVLVTYGEPLSRLWYLTRPGAMAWGVEVFCVTKPEGMSNMGTFGEQPLGQQLVKGPYDGQDEDTMAGLSGIEGVHFVYVLTKRPLPVLTAAERRAQEQEQQAQQQQQEHHHHGAAPPAGETSSTASEQSTSSQQREAQ